MKDNVSNCKVIIFDFGGVLIDWNPRYLYRKMFDGDSDAMERFLDEIGFVEWNTQQDAGRSFDEGVALLCNQFPHYCDLISAFDTRWEETIAGPIWPTVDILHELKVKNYPLYGLSNWSAEKYRLVRPKYEFFNWFEDIIISGEVGLIKPDWGIFELLLDRIRLEPSACLIIDDSAKNVSVAEGMGFCTIRYQSPSQLRDELSRYDL